MSKILENCTIEYEKKERGNWFNLGLRGVTVSFVGVNRRDQNDVFTKEGHVSNNQNREVPSL